MASEEQLKLSHFIKSVHENLRCSSRAKGIKQAWIEHRKKEGILADYATAMHTLATKYWESNSQGDQNNRIDWVVNQCHWYFFDGGLQNITERDMVKVRKMEESIYQVAVEDTESNSAVEFLKPLQMLDVGSCYNPFKRHSLFNILAVDLVPATKDVLQCDFLQLEVKEQQTSSDCLAHLSERLSSLVTSDLSQCGLQELPADSFDVVNFSLFLEYLPSSQLRYECCQKAFYLLKPGGLLFIITPDSKHASANAPIMRSWRIALGTIGFVRICYQKLTHLHCMAFRKCPYTVLRSSLVGRYKRYAKSEPSDMIMIPQDSEKTNEAKTLPEANTILNSADISYFAELPATF